MNPWPNKSYVCWSWNSGQETPDVPNSIIYVAINKNTSITVIPELANNIMTHTNTLGKYQHNQLSCISPPAMLSTLLGEKMFSLLLEEPFMLGMIRTTIWLEIVTPGFVSFAVVTIQVLSTETVPARVGQTHIQDQILLVATTSMTPQMRKEWVRVPVTTNLQLWGSGKGCAQSVKERLNNVIYPRWGCGYKCSSAQMLRSECCSV